MGKAVILEGFSFRLGNIGSVTIREDVAIIDISIDAPTDFTGMYIPCRVTYNPANTNQTGVTWSITSGNEYATISSNGLITVDSSADGEDIVVRAESIEDSNIYATKTINVTYEHQSDYITSITITGDSTITGSEAVFGVTYNPSDTYLTGVIWTIDSGSSYASINSSSGRLTIKEAANASEVVIKATSIYDDSVYGTKTLTLTYLDAIYFEDSNTKTICVNAWDTNGNGEISHVEAEAVTTIGSQFKDHTEIVSFDEFRFFTNVTGWARPSYGFKGCTGLKYITLPSSLTDICGPTYGEKFAGCTSLERINLDSITNYVISSSDFTSAIFNGCSNLVNIGQLNDEVTIIGLSTFKSCSKLLLTSLPSSLVHIGSDAFNGCAAATFSVIPSGVTTIGGRSLSGVGSTVLDFSQCTSLTTIPSNMARFCANLELIKLPSSLTSIGRQAFYNGKAGLTIICYATTPPTVDETAFGGTTAPAAIYVPDASVDTYKATSGWSSFSSKIKPLSEYTE